jgi:hypothetical protein
MGRSQGGAVLAAAVLLLWGAEQARAQGLGDVTGTWRLLSAAAFLDGVVADRAPFGSSPSGRLTYTADGTVSAIVSAGGRRPLSVADLRAAPAAERAEAFATSLAYAGRYRVSADTIIHHVEVASVENWVGTDLVRLARRDGDQLTLETPPLSYGGRLKVFTLVWARMR